ncbi:ABC transporter [Paraphaeosphaeria minitans]|uniref:ABC transporter n=1 Tax=Paraphaeosphaeria minitans TaxID=565426 RepID=A0A9P6G3X2_9PLEO|nr:ABC transporter [Paraphaeosphaeria minitans]
MRSVITLALSISTLLVSTERHLDEEAPLLLGHGNASRELAEPDNWIEYLQGFVLFMPHLWSLHDSKFLCALAVRSVVVLVDRYLKIYVPGQLGLAFDKIVPGSGEMPWGNIALWSIGQLLDSRAGSEIPGKLASSHIQNMTEEKARIRSLEHLLRLDSSFQVAKTEAVLFQVFPVFLDLVIALVYVNILFGIYPTLAILSMSAIYISTGTATSSWIQQQQRMLNETSRTQSKVEHDVVSNWYTVVCFDRIKDEIVHYAAVVRDRLDTSHRKNSRFLIAVGMQDCIMQAGSTGCVILIMRQVSTNQTSIGMLVNFMFYWNPIRSTVKQLTNSYEMISNILACAEEILRFHFTEPSVIDAEFAKDLVVANGDIRFHNVGFSYERGRTIIERLDLSIGAGQTIAFVGESGGGKSTILGLLLQFYDVCKGPITIDGQDIRKVTLSSLRKAIGIVPQNPELFNKSILENVRYGRSNATDDEVETACKAAAIHDRIIEFSAGYDTVVGEGGVRMSGGERQRLAIARILLKNPKVVLLDEATSAVDAEAKIQKAVSDLSSGRTTIIVAHRLSTIVKAHHILVVHKGIIVENGTHDDLLAKKGRYDALWKQQTLTKED